jgi:hypothetical protein
MLQHSEAQTFPRLQPQHLEGVRGVVVEEEVSTTIVIPTILV